MKSDDVLTDNRLTVLKAIRHGGPVSRSELPALTGLSGGTITQVTSDLMQRGLVLERKLAATKPGRPRTHLVVNSAGAIVIGASVMGQGLLSTAFVDLSGDLLFSFDVKLSRPDSFAGYAEAMAEGLRSAIDQSPFEHADVTRIGIALPAVIESARGMVYAMTTLPSGPFPFAQAIEDLLDIPVTLESDSVCMARAEHWFGRARNWDTFTLVNVGFWIGSAEYANGVPKSDLGGFNPEMGHFKTVWSEDGRPCLCGGKGCLATYSSMFGILKHLRRLDDLPFPPVQALGERFRHLVDAAESGEAEARGLIELAGVHLGVAIANYLNLTAARTVLILVPDSRFQDLIAESFNAALRKNTLPVFLETTKVSFDVTSEDWRWKGAASLALERAYEVNG